MERTRLGVTIGLMGFIGYLLSGLSGLWVVVMFMLFILMTETSDVLRVNVVQATILCAAFSVLEYLIGGYDSVVNVIGINFLYRIGSFVRSFVSIAQIIFTLMAAMNALSGKVLSIPIVTPLVEQHFGKIQTPQ